MIPLVYLACPYSHADPAVSQSRFEKANLVAGLLMRQGHVVFSPLSHTHPIDAALGGEPESWEFWQPQDLAILSLSSQIMVLMLDGWRQSVGVTHEIQFAKERGIPVVYLSPEDFGL